MVTELTDEFHEIGNRQVLSLDRVFRHTIRVVDGCVWLTQFGVFEDIVLSPGERCTIRSRGRVVILALSGPARLSISRNVAPAGAWRVLWRALKAQAFPRLRAGSCR